MQILNSQGRGGNMGMHKVFKHLQIFALVLSLSLIIFIAAPKKAQACCSCVQEVTTAMDTEWLEADTGTIDVVNNHVTDEFVSLRSWIVSTLFEDNLAPAMMWMTEQLSAVAMQQMQIIGSFLDAKHQMETQQVFQKLQARAHKDYHPSVGMCEFGSNVKSLAASESKAEFAKVVLSQRSQDRALGSTYTAASIGEDADKRTRLKQFREKFCDPLDNNGGLNLLCKHDDGVGAWDKDENEQALERMNKDIDYVRTVAAPWTLDIDFSDDELTNHEEEVLALASNLYGHYVFKRPPPDSLNPDPNSITDMQKYYMDARSVLAKRSVAENSFNAITSMKAQGAPGSREFMRAVLSELGADVDNVNALIGEDINPSYYAQMEILTKKIFQNPDFYTNLYDKPANVQRKNVAIQAVGLMQKFDLFKSYLRNEASLSILLELAVMDLQQEVDNEFGRMTGGGLPAENVE